MDTRVWIPVIVVAVAILLAVVLLVSRRRRSEHLKDQFGPEYDRTLKMHGDAHKAEAVLLDREKRVEKLVPTELDTRRTAEEVRRRSLFPNAELPGPARARHGELIVIVLGVDLR